METTLKNGSQRGKRTVPLPAIARNLRLAKRPTAKAVEKMLREMGFKPMNEALRSRMKKSGHWGMPTE